MVRIIPKLIVLPCNIMIKLITYSSPDESKNIRKKANHNETEKRRIKNISKAIDDMRDILDVSIRLLLFILRKQGSITKLIRFPQLTLLVHI